MDQLYFWQEAPLLDVPPEIRQVIYRELAMSIGIVIIRASDSTIDLHKAAVVRRPISSVCRLLHAEAASAIGLYSLIESPRYFVELTAFDFGKLSQLSDFLVHGAEKRTRKRKELFLKLSLGSRMEASLNNIYHETWRYVNVKTPPAPSPVRFANVPELRGLQWDINDTMTADQLCAGARAWRMIVNEQKEHGIPHDSVVSLTAGRLQTAFEEAHTYEKLSQVMHG